MNKSKTITRKRKREIESNRKLTPSQRLEAALKLSNLCSDLKKAGKKAITDGSGTRS